MDIEVVLTENNPKIGKRGEVVKVAPGFATNFLIPQGKAKLATAANLKSFELEKAKHAKQESVNRSHAEELAKKINLVSLTLEVLVGEADKLYGAVTSQEIHNALSKQGLSVEKKDIYLEEPIRKLGAFQVPVKLYADVSATLKLWVVKKS